MAIQNNRYQIFNPAYIQKVADALESRIQKKESLLHLKNGIDFIVGRNSTGDIQIYDTEPNLIAEFDNERCGDALTQAAVFIIKVANGI